jgi:hypothetical protein
MARPRKQIDTKLVTGLAGIGCTVAEIAVLCGCSKATLDRRYASAIEKGRANLNMSLKRQQVEIAKAGNVTMLIWLGKQYLGQSDKQEVETHGDNSLTVVEEIVTARVEDSTVENPA